MALPALAMASLAELKSYMGGITGIEADSRLEDCLVRASVDIEGQGLGGRRGVYRGPVESYTSVVNGQAIVASGALTIAGAPDSAGRTLIVRKTDTDRSLTAGTLTISQAAPVLRETFDLTLAIVQHGVKVFTAAVTATLSGCVGMNTGDTIDVGASAGYTEFYSPCPDESEITPLEWPLQYVADLREDYARLFGTATALVEGTSFELRNNASIKRRIARISGSFDWAWQYGRRTVRARLSAGWAGIANVPQSVKSVCLELAAWHFQYSDRKEFGLTSRSDDLGSVTRSGPPMLTPGMLNRLAPEWRGEFVTTAERGWVEAA